ncbi:MAG: hypothetical protein AMXMBFR52_29860 [Burkholderiales bacterium]
MPDAVPVHYERHRPERTALYRLVQQHAAILERPVIEKILAHLGLDPQPPPRGRAREAGHDRSRLAPAIRRPSRAADTSRHRLRSLAPAAGDTCAACRRHAA